MIPEKLKTNLSKLGLDESIYQTRSRKCFLSRAHVNLETVPWYDHAYYVPDNFDSKEKDRSTGGASFHPFIFDPVSLVPCLALTPTKKDKILDMCAAPGTKTYILSFLTENEADITANDISFNRVRRLRFNAGKLGLSVNILNKSGRKLEGEFDKILLDAPCSGEGMINKNEKIFGHWSEKRVKLLSRKQKKLLMHAFELLKPGGTLVYSTCTFEPEENEAVIDNLLEKSADADVEEIKTGVKHADGLIKWNDTGYDERVQKCVRIYPEHNGTGGFFVCKIRKSVT